MVYSGEWNCAADVFAFFNEWPDPEVHFIDAYMANKEWAVLFEKGGSKFKLVGCACMACNDPIEWIPFAVSENHCFAY